MRVSDIPITGKFLLIISLFGAFSVTATIVASSEMKVIDAGYTAAAHQQGQAALFVSRGGSALRATKNAIEDLVISPSAVATEKALTALSKERRNLADLLNHAKAADPTQAAAIDDIMRRDFDVIDKTCAKTIEAGRKISNPADALQAQAEYLSTCAPAYEPLTGSLRKQVETTSEIENRLEQDLSARSIGTVFWNFAFSLGGTILVSIAGFFAVRSWISRAINDLAGTMRRLAGGDLSVTVDGTMRRDELGLMAKAVQTFKENGLQLQAAESEAARQRQSVERERAANEAARTAFQRQQQDVVDALAKGLDRLSKGDLNISLNGGFPPDYEKLRADFNAAVASLKEAMSTISTVSDGISSGSDQIATASDDLSRRTEQQAASLEQTAAALSMIMGTVTTMAENAKEAASAVLLAREAAGASGAVVLEAIGAMDEIKQSSGQISNIVSVIDEIAFQTNLLALNAGVEAARAGDAGRGFAVVASEVRALAQRSAEAAKEIKALISASSRKVEAGVDLVGKTGHALKDIESRVTKIDHLMREIAGAAKEQATGLAEINVAVGQMDQIVQQNAAMVEESTAAAYTLKGEVLDLASMIGRFQIGAMSTAHATAFS